MVIPEYFFDQDPPYRHPWVLEKLQPPNRRGTPGRLEQPLQLCAGQRGPPNRAHFPSLLLVDKQLCAEGKAIQQAQTPVRFSIEPSTYFNNVRDTLFDFDIDSQTSHKLREANERWVDNYREGILRYLNFELCIGGIYMTDGLDRTMDLVDTAIANMQKLESARPRTDRRFWISFADPCFFRPLLRRHLVPDEEFERSWRRLASLLAKERSFLQKAKFKMLTCEHCRKSRHERWSNYAHFVAELSQWHETGQHRMRFRGLCPRGNLHNIA